MKVDSSNYADWVRKLRIILIAAQKAYVLNAPLGVLNLSVAVDVAKHLTYTF